jgi:hypothetical protein
MAQRDENEQHGPWEATPCCSDESNHKILGARGGDEGRVDFQVECTECLNQWDVAARF